MKKLLVLVALGFAVVAAPALACEGPCCLPDGTCERLDVPVCESAGGFSWPGELSCEQVVHECAEVSMAECRMTGGGIDDFNVWNGSMAGGQCEEPDGTNTYTYGGQAGAPTASQPQPHGEWTHHQKRGPDGRWVFHAGTSSAPPGTEIDWIGCEDPGWCVQARQAPAKQINFEGVGTFKNMRQTPAKYDVVTVGESLHWFRVHVEDLGEPGRGGKQDPPATCPPGGSEGALADCDCPDFYSFTVHEGPTAASPVLYHVHGYTRGGNLQIHPAIH